MCLIETLEKDHADCSIEMSLVKCPMNSLICVFLTTQNIGNFEFVTGKHIYR